MLRAWPITLCLAVAYFLTGYAGLMLPAAGSNITLVWLPTGIAVATLYRWGFGCWPGVTIGALAVNLAIGTSVPLSLGIAVGNTLGPLLATGILVRAGFRRDLKRWQDILLLTAAAMVGMLITASIGVTSLTLAGQLPNGQLSAWLIWWAGDVTGVIAAAPLILVTSRSELRSLWVRRIEFICWVASITLSIAIVFLFNGARGAALAIAFLPFPLVVWAAIRFGVIGTSLGVIVLSFGAAVGTSAGYGPFYGSVPADSVLMLSLFMATTAAVGWLVSALTVAQLEAVGTRRILERALEEVSFGVLVAGVDRRMTYANSGFTRLTGYSQAEMLGKSCAVLQGPDTDPITSEELKAALHGPRNFDGDILNYRKDGSTFWNALLITPIFNEHGENTGFLGIQRDVTDRKLGQLALSRSEERFRAIFELEPECVKIVSPYGHLEAMNPAGLAMIEADSLEQVRGSRLESLIAPENQAAFRELNERVTRLGESGTCEFAITGLKGTHRWLETHAVPYRNEKHQIIGLLAVTRDITQQKTATAELERIVATLKLFIDSVPAMIAFVDAEEKYRMVNRQYEQFFGLRADQILDRHIADIHSPEAYAVIVPRIREVLGGRSVHYQDVIRRPDGSQFWYEARYIPRQEADGRVSGFYVMVFDVSERMRAENALKESEARLNSFFFESPVGMAIFDTQGRWSHMNPTLATINGLPAESHIGRRPHELLAPELADGITASVQHILETGEADINREVSGMTPAQPGVTRHWLFTQSPILGPDQRITGVGAVVIETTAQKQSEEALRASEERFRMYVDHAPNGVFVIDSQGRYTDVNPAACRQTGYSRDELLLMRIMDLTPADAVAQSFKAFEKLKADGIVEYEQPLQCKSGMTRWFTLAAAPLSNSHFIGFTSDIQRLKETENALRQSRDRFEYLVSSCPAVIYSTKPSGDYAATFISQNVRSLLGYEPEQFLADPDFWASRIHPEDVAGVYQALPKLLELGRQRQEFRFRTSTGEYRWLDDEMVLSRDATGEPREIIGYLIDITDRKRIEQALSKSEEQSRLALDAAELGTWRHFVFKGTLELDDRAQQILHFERSELTSAEFSQRIHPDDLARVEEERRRAAVPGTDGSFATEHRILLLDGQTRWISVRAKIIFETNDGVPTYVLGTIQDITARKRAGEALQENETRLRLALAAANQGLYDLNVQTGECLVSPEYALMLGYDPTVFRETNSDWRERLHPDDREAVYKVFEEYVAGQRDEYRVEFRQRTKSGEWKWILSIGAVVSHAVDGQPLRMLGTHTDISARKRVEEQLRQSNAILQAVTNVQREFLVDSAPGQSFERLLKLLLEQTESEYGFIGQVLHRADGQPFLKTHAITNIAWDDATRAFYDQGAPEGLEFTNLNTLFGAVITSRQAVVANDPANDPRRGGLPSGHPRLDAFLGLPLFHGTELIGMVGMANRPDGYNDRIVEAIQPILATCAGLVLAYRLQSDQLKAAAALRESEARYRTLIETSSDAIFVMDLSGRILSANRAAVQMHGYSEEELRSMRMQDVNLTEDAAELPERLGRLQSGESLRYDVVHRRKDGTTFPVEVVASAVQIGGDWLTLAFGRDITERNQAIRSLEEAERRQRLALDAARMGTWEWEIGSDRLTWDDRQQILFGFEPGVFNSRVDTLLNLIHPDDLAAVRQIFADTPARMDFDEEFRIRFSSGEVRWICGSGIRVPKSDHRPPRLVGINYDITQRKRAEDTVRRILDGIAPTTGREFFRVLVDYLCKVCEVEYAFVGGLDPHNPDQIKTIAVSHRGQVADNFTYDLHATPCEQVVGQSICSYPTGVRSRFPHDAMLIEMGIDAYLGTPLWFSNGEALGLIVLLHDRPMPNPEQAEVVLKVVAARAVAEFERQQADAALRESEERLQIFVENAPAGVAMLDRELRYISYSRRWLTDYGLGEQSLIGRSHYEVFPEISDRWREIHRRCLTGVSERCEQDRFERADGTASYLRWEIQPWTDATGAIGGLVFFTELITERVTAQKQLQASLREKESMLKEIHHRVKNNLQVISSLLSLQAASVTQPDALGVLAESQNRVRAMALVHETLYQSHDLADVDLSRYLGELCEYLFRSYGVDVARVRLDLDVEAVNVSLDKTIHCGLLVNEIVSNSLKHAFPGNRSGTITVRAQIKPDGRLSLVLADDGIGLAADLMVEQTPSLGLRLIRILTEQLGGELTIERTTGTRFVLLFPDGHNVA